MLTMKPKQIVRRSVPLSPDLDRRVQQLARHQSRSTASMLEVLIEAGLRAKEAEKQRFFELADRLRATNDVDEIQQIKGDLARMTFGS